MPKVSLLDFDALLAPIPGADPAGEPLADAVRSRLEEWRKEPDPMEPATADRQANWKGIVQLASETLAGKSKDLLVAVRLVEALTKMRNFTPLGEEFKSLSPFAGVRAGFHLLRRLVTECWDRMHPIPEPGEGMEIREGPFRWINDSTRGARYPSTLSSIPVIEVRGEKFNYFDWIHPTRKLEFAEAIPKAEKPKEVQALCNDLQALDEDLREAFAELRLLNECLDQKLTSDSLDLLSPENPTNIGKSLTEYQGMVEEILRRLGAGASVNTPVAESTLATSEVKNETTFDLGPVSTNREALYRQLEEIASALQRLEPHSPVPYFLRRAVRLGGLAFPELMRAIIRESSTLDELDRLLGLEPKAE